MKTRELKFRVYGSEYMSNPFTLHDLQSGKIQFTSDCYVMQFTGLKDKLGNEIYEGDKIKKKEMKTLAIAMIYLAFCGTIALSVYWTKSKLPLLFLVFVPSVSWHDEQKK